MNATANLNVRLADSRNPSGPRPIAVVMPQLLARYGLSTAEQLGERTSGKRTFALSQSGRELAFA
jgi:hypothetical protein